MPKIKKKEKRKSYSEQRGEKRDRVGRAGHAGPLGFQEDLGFPLREVDRGCWDLTWAGSLAPSYDCEEDRLWLERRVNAGTPGKELALPFRGRGRWPEL